MNRALGNNDTRSPKFMKTFLGNFNVSLSRWISLKFRTSRNRNPLPSFTHASGQALVEFTLMFLLFLIIAWIPADFGLAFYTGQLAQNAAREGARIAAADSTLIEGPTSCIMPPEETVPCTGNIFKETAARISAA